MGAPVKLESILRPVIVTIIALVVVIALASAIHPSGLTVLGIVLWLVALGVAAAGVYLAVVGSRPIAGAGAVVTAVAVLLAFFWLSQPSPLVWTVLFFVGIILIAIGTAPDSLNRASWPIVLGRVVFGWALVDNAQDHFRTNWLPGGGGFLQIATQAAKHPPVYFFDPVYQGFLSSVVVPNGDLWAGLTIGGELTFGTLLAVGLFASVAAVGAMWQNGNYILMKSVVTHGAYTDKAFFTLELIALVTAAGLSYGLDASLRRFVPSWVAANLMGAPTEELERAPVARPQPRPGLP